MADTQQVLDMIKEHDVKYVDFRFTDPRGKWQHLAHHVRTITDEFLSEGVPFDGSSIAGWKAINESDMLLVPDCSTAVLDPFAAQTSLVQREPEEGRENPASVHGGRQEAGRRGLREVPGRHADLGNPEARRDDLRDDLLVEHEAVGVRREVHGLQHLSAERAIARCRRSTA